MPVSRRSFLKISAGAATAAVFGGLGTSLSPTEAHAQLLKLHWAKRTTSVCCYCAVGCGLIVSTARDGQGRAINVEGDPDHPVNGGALCSKGSSIWQVAENDRRLNGPLYRAPYSDEWKSVSWDWSITEIAKRIKKARDDSFMERDGKGRLVNRTESMAHLGSAALDNEECWTLQAVMRALGLVYIEHQARICHSSTVAALAESYGRGAMTNHWNDIGNSDCVLIMGGNAAECHPISFKWVTAAMKKGAPLIHVDPRYTRTSAKADIYTKLRSGTDIAFLGGMMKYILDKELYFKEYVVNYTNAAFIVDSGYSFSNGVFSGLDRKAETYDKSKWAFKKDENGVPLRDPTLKDPRCVLNLMRDHYKRYTVEKVSATTGTPVPEILKVYETFCATGKPDKAGTILYAMGWTQHTVGVQNIRAMSMIQMLLGNIGVAGGGVNALRGESNVQGSTDHSLLAHIIPGYLPIPSSKWETIEAYNKANTPESKDPMSANWWANRPKYLASLLKAQYPGASLENAYKYLPKVDGGTKLTEYMWLGLWDKVFKGEFKGLFAWGQNPACGGANAGKNRDAMTKLDWMVNVNIFDNETGSFWKGPGMEPGKIKTEVFLLPCCVSIEKEGSVTNSGRWMQWRYVGPEPRPGTKPDGQIMLEIMDKVKELYRAEGGAFPMPVTALNTDTWKNAEGEYDANMVAKLINGYFLKDTEVNGKQFKRGQQVPNFTFLTDDGSTCSGNWLYSGSYTDEGNMAARRDSSQTPEQAKIGLYPNWSWCWPLNRRILYNRASVDANGKPWNPDRAVIEWNGEKWVGDVPDGGWKPGTKHPFIMQQHGYGQLFGPGRVDGPLPEHYEPMECPIKRHPFSGQLNNPVAYQIHSEEKAVADPRFPYVGTTYRMTEHWQTGIMTRHVGWLIEAEPQLYCEISEELAGEKGIANGEHIKVSSLRGEVTAVAMVTKRIQPYTIQGKTVHLVGLPWQYGWFTPADGGDSANLLTPSVGDPNTGIPETKAFMVNVMKIEGA